MQHVASGKVPPQPVPHTYARRPAKSADRRLLMISAAIQRNGVSYDPDALAEQTGLPVDAIRRFAAQIVVHQNMVALDMIDHEDATRMGSEALAASLRMEAERRDCPATILHRAVGLLKSATVLTTADVMGLRRLARRGGDRRPVVAPRTTCPRCGARSDVDGGCRHQRALALADNTAQGFAPHA